MPHLTRAHDELFKRQNDEIIETFDQLYQRCRDKKRESTDLWQPPTSIILDNTMQMVVGTDGAYALNDWSFSQVCRLANVSKDTVNRLSPATASLVFGETMPHGDKPLQIHSFGRNVRSIHGTQYTRLWDVDLLSVVKEFAVDFQPPQKACNGGTGLYAGEQDMFVFLIDPLGWVEIGSEAFAPGFFVWNSEVGRRSLGIQTFWFQAICQNHIVWDAVEVVEWTRKHTAKVGDGLHDIRRIIEGLVQKRDARKDGFAAIVKKAMEKSLDEDSEKVLSLLNKNGINRPVARQALELAQQQGRFTVWSVIDALTRITGAERNAGDRTEADQKAANLFQLLEV